MVSLSQNWIVRGGDVASLRYILGHSSLEITQRYIALSSEDAVSKKERFNPIEMLLTVNYHLRTEEYRLLTTIYHSGNL